MYTAPIPACLSDAPMNKADAPLGAVIMAAGNATRFGENKLMRPFQGKPMAAHIMELLAALPFTETIVVTQYPALAQLAEAHGFTVVINSTPEKGVSGTIRLGIETLLKRQPQTAGCLFAVADQPYLETESVDTLCALWQEDKSRIAALGFEGKRGNPVIFPCDLFSELQALTGDVGGSRVIKAHADRLILCPVKNGMELLDIDTPNDLLP